MDFQTHKRNLMYNHPSMIAERAPPKIDPIAELHDTQRAEKARLASVHRAAHSNLLDQQAVELGKHGQPVGREQLEQTHKIAVVKLHAKHNAERRAMGEKHSKALDALAERHGAK